MSKKCQNCSAELAENMNFCPKCHAKYEAPDSTNSASRQDNPEVANAAPSQAPKVELDFWAKMRQKRMTRKDFWLLFLIFMLLNAAVMFIPIVGQIIVFIIGICMICNAAARLHDAGKSAWNLLWLLLPIVGGIILLVLYCQPSEKGENAWGPEPQRMFGGN